MGLRVGNEELVLSLDSDNLSYLAEFRRFTATVIRGAKYFTVVVDVREATELPDGVNFSYVRPDGSEKLASFDEDSGTEVIVEPAVNGKRTKRGGKSTRNS